MIFLIKNGIVLLLFKNVCPEKLVNTKKNCKINLFLAPLKFYSNYCKKILKFRLTIKLVEFKNDLASTMYLNVVNSFLVSCN